MKKIDTAYLIEKCRSVKDVIKYILLDMTLLQMHTLTKAGTGNTVNVINEFEE